jgi:alpha-beta hydrolase superfamily lysophospholipase
MAPRVEKDQQIDKIVQIGAPGRREERRNGMERTFTFEAASDGTAIAAYSWPAPSRPRAVVQIAHGLAEHAGRYRRLAAALNAAGIAAYANDHRGHGASIAPGASPGDFGAGGWEGLVGDMSALTSIIRRENPAAPVILLGHSMGSFAAQTYLLDRSDGVEACALSGSSDLPSLVALAMSGADMSFAAFNKPFEPARTAFDWLSRDHQEVDAYVNDPLCGFEAPPETAFAIMAPAARYGEPDELRRIRRDIPILIFSGRDDPLSGGGALIEKLAVRYRNAGVERVTTKLYEGARHELFNEINRDEVTRDFVAWIDEALR